MRKRGRKGVVESELMDREEGFDNLDRESRFDLFMKFQVLKAR